MISKNLEEKELKDASKIISKYKKIESSLNNVQKQLEKLDDTKEKLLRELDSVRNEEVEFFDKLKNKHGEGKLDLYTMKYIVTNEPTTNLELDQRS